MFDRMKLRKHAIEIAGEVEPTLTRQPVPRSLGPFLELLFAALGPVLVEWLKKWIKSKEAS